MENGIEPGSSKAKLIVAWVERIHRDPTITSNVQQTRALFLGAQSRSDLVADGLARLAPPRRLQYVTLITRFLDTLVPTDCFGLNDMSEVVNHVSLGEMSEADIDEYFRMLLDAIRASASNAPLDVPTPQQSADAQTSLRQRADDRTGQHGGERRALRGVYGEPEECHAGRCMLGNQGNDARDPGDAGTVS